jgi:actin-related protein
MIDQSPLRFDMNYYQDGMAAEPILNDGLIENWQYLESLLSHLFESSLKINTSETPFLFTEKPYTSSKTRRK